MRCKNCGAEITVDSETQIGACEHCKASYVTQDLIEKEVELSEEEIEKWIKEGNPK